MEAALLVLLLGHLATALEVPLDRKATDHRPTQHDEIQEDVIVS